MVATLTMACSASADLSGEVFVAGPSGDTWRGADVEVILVPGHAVFEGEWHQLVEAFHAHRTRALALAREGEEVKPAPGPSAWRRPGPR